MRAAILALLIVLAPDFVSAQEATEVRFYFVPKIGTGVRPDSFRPKYVTPATMTAPIPAPLISVDWQGMDYGSEEMFFIAVDVTTEQHTTLSAQTDVLSVPAPLDTQVSGPALPVVQAQLEAMNIPASWVTTDNTYREVLRAAGKMVLIMQRYQGLFGDVRLFESGITLGTRWNQLSATQRQRLQDVAASLNIDTSGLTGAMTLRQILRAVGDQLPAFSFGGETF